MKGIKKYFSLNIVVIFKLVLFGLIFSFFSIAINADSVELYEDPATGQVFTKPGPGRKKISSSDINQGSSKSNSKLKVNGRVQVRSVAGQKDSVFSNGHSDYNAWDTGFRRLRIGLAYEGDKWWGGIVDLKMENLLNSPYSTTKSVTIPGADGNSYTVLKEEKLNDSRGGVQEANIWVKAPFMSSIFYFGQQRVRFLRENLETSANLLTTERAFSASFLQQWDIGIFADIHPLELINKKYTHYMKVSGSVMNGKGSGHEGVGRQRVLTDTHSGTQPLLITPMLSWRIEVNPFD
ncbi:MAG: hypothetical protein KDK90_23900, partial [Leptospiraceae bacterium]|nr:hypothetical protein [Leptospiraceae bacterium]